jgi:gliding motility-associated-like protein
MTKRILIFCFAIGFPFLLSAQVCTGRLGSPTATFNFGSQNIPSNISSNTSYQISAGCPGKGQYSMQSLVFSCAAGDWHTLVADHTSGDVNGIFMLVNAAPIPSDLFSGTADLACDNTNYEFSFWVANMVKAGTCTEPDPNFEFTVESLSGSLLASGTSGTIPQTNSPSWVKVGGLFRASPGVTKIRFTIKTKTAGGCGNAFALDDIELAPCGPDMTVSIGTAGATSINLCIASQQAIPIQATYTNSYTNPRLQWQVFSEGATNWADIPGATATTYLRPPSLTGTYLYRLSMAEGNNISSVSCRVYSSPIIVSVQSSPNIQVTNYVYGCFGSEVVLQVAGGTSYSWSGPNGFASNLPLVSIPHVQYSHAGKYKVTAFTTNGCSGTDSMNLVIYPAATIAVGPGVSICEGTSTTLNAAGGLRFRWWPAETLSNDTVANPVARPKDSTLYHVSVTNQYGCSDTGSIVVNVWKKPKANAGPDKKIPLGGNTQLNGKITGSALDYFWTPTNAMTGVSTLTPTVNPTIRTVYTLHAVSKEGCGTSTDDVEVQPFDKVIIPNAFSPNNDGVNDTWFIEPLYIFQDCKVEVYNRFGALVYRSNGYGTPWNGTKNGQPLPTGTYYYFIDIKIPGKLPYTGSVTILR